MHRIIISLFLFAFAGIVHAESPYAGQQDRRIKALSEDEISGYLAGRGLGLARAAELNGYPGPRHVLDAADRLELSAAQKHELEQVFVAMQSAAVPLGRDLVDRETELDRAFSGRTITTETLARLTADIGRLQGAIRAVHLRAHLSTQAILTSRQIEAYNQMRGYITPTPEKAKTSP